MKEEVIHFRIVLVMIIQIIFLLFISSCSFLEINDGALQPTEFEGHNNSKEFISEYPLGDMIYGNNQINKNVPLFIGENNYGYLSCSIASITDKSINDIIYTYIVFPVRNISTQYSLPFVKANNIVYRTSNGKFPAENPFTFCYGSVGRMISNCSNTCLAPGEKGYFILIDNIYWQDILGIELDLEFSDFYINEPKSKIIPIEGNIEDGTLDHDQLSFEYKNFGKEKGEIEWLGNILFFFEEYDSEIPIYFTYLDHDSFLDTVYPLGTGTFNSGNIYFNGNYLKVSVQLNFSDYDLSREITKSKNLKDEQLIVKDFIEERNDEIVKSITMMNK